LLYSICLNGRAELGLATDEYAALSMVLLRLFAFKPSSPFEKKTPKLADPVSSPSVARPVLQVTPLQPLPQSMAPPPMALGPANLPPTIIEQSDASSDANIPLAGSEIGKQWFELVQQLSTTQKIQAMTRELAMQAQLISRDVDVWVLHVERESLLSAANIERLQLAVQTAGHDVVLNCKLGAAADTPAIRMTKQQKQALDQFEQKILNDPHIQNLIAEFDAKIVPGSLKPRTS
jgi:DNA polymerase-3 subunit gamma/tau